MQVDTILQQYDFDGIQASIEDELFRSFIKRVHPRFEFYNHVDLLIERLQAVSDGEIGRLMVFMPPRHGKSEVTSRLFPAYYLNRFPHKWVGLNSYAAEIAYGFSRNARDFYKKIGNSLKSDAGAVKQWETESGGGLWAAGVGGPITGKGFHIGLIDDPIKNAEEAQSDTIREKHKDWWKSTFYSRAEPDAGIVIIQTRWHHDDISGWLLDREKEEPESWHIVNFEAIKSKTQIQVPGTCAVEEDARDPGDPLCADRYPLDRLEKIQKAVGSLFWAAMYQQRPSPEEGGKWKQWFIPVPDAEFPNIQSLENYGTDWDTAFTQKEENSASAYITSGKLNGNMYIHRLGAVWKEFPELITFMSTLPSPHYVEAKASGKSAKQTLRANGIPAVEVKVDGGADKIARANAATPRAESGFVYVKESLLDYLYNDEKQGILKFPVGPNDDLADALAQAVQRHYSRPQFSFAPRQRRKKRR